MTGAAPALSWAFARQASATLATRLAGAVTGLLTAILVSRALGPDGRGAFAGAMALAAMGTQIANLGLPSSNTYFVARDKGLVVPLLGNSLAVALLGGAFAAAIVAGLKFGAGRLQQAPPLLVFGAMLWIPAGLAYLLISNLLLGSGRIARFNQAEIGLRVATLVITAALYFAGTGAAWEMFYGALAAQALAAAFVLFAIPGWRQAARLASSELLRRQLPFALKSYLALVLAFVLLRIDQLMVQAISGNTEAGLYSIAASLADILYMLPAAIGVIAFPQLSSMRDRPAKLQAVRKLLSYTGALMTAGGLVAWLIAPVLVPLFFGADFAASVPMFQILIPAIAFYGLNNIFSNYFMAEGLPAAAVWVWVVAVIVNITLNLLWIPSYGGRGAAAASLVAYTAVLILHALLLVRVQRSSK